jgi:HSP20 family protein
MDVFETDAAVVLKLSLPGVKACDVRITYEGDVVTISGCREAEPEPDLVAYHRMEIRNGYFERRVIIQKPINPEEAEAEYRNGFLKLSIPKTSAPKQRVYTLKIRL